MDISIIPEKPVICTDNDFRFERFHCGGNGGQNVNKVETGVRLTHIPTGITVTSTTERLLIKKSRNSKEKQNKKQLKKKCVSRNGHPLLVDP